jgi:uncharacterized protein (PEP-CTERM system associated)
VRSDNSYTWTTQTNAPLENVYFGQHAAELVRAATPLGGSVRVQRDVTRFDEQRGVDQTLDVARATVSYAFTPQFTAGLRGGYESTNYTRTEESGPIYGFDVAWSTPLTNLTGFWEDRFFGSSYQVDVSSRLRTFATDFAFSRSVSTYPEVLLQLPTGGNVSSLLNSILIGRFPDPVERARQVQDLMQSQALPSSLPGPVNIYSRNANVLTSGSGTFALIGVRNTLALTLYYLKTELLPDAAIPPTFIAFNDNVQKGATLTLSHRLTPVMSLNATAGWSETRGIGQSAGTVSDQSIFEVQVSRQLTLRSSAFIGARYQQQDSTSNAIGDRNEAAIFVGLFHRL